MALVNDYLELQAFPVGFFNPFKKVRALAVLEGVVSFFGELFPVDKAAVVFRKSRSHHIAQKFCGGIVNVQIHLALALFLKVSLAGREPDKNRARVPLHIFVHKMGEHYRLSAAGRAL